MGINCCTEEAVYVGHHVHTTYDHQSDTLWVPSVESMTIILLVYTLKELFATLYSTCYLACSICRNKHKLRLYDTNQYLPYSMVPV